MELLHISRATVRGDNSKTVLTSAVFPWSFFNLLILTVICVNIFTDPELEDSPERKLELLYGVTLPDWCVHGTDLPGIYKEIAEKTTDACDAIDTNRLFPILMASSLPRDQLGHIWNRANQAVPGQLNLLELRIVLGLVALGQVCSPVLLVKYLD